MLHHSLPLFFFRKSGVTPWPQIGHGAQARTEPSARRIERAGGGWNSGASTLLFVTFDRMDLRKGNYLMSYGVMFDVGADLKFHCTWLLQKLMKKY